MSKSPARQAITLTIAIAIIVIIVLLLVFFIFKSIYKPASEPKAPQSISVTQVQAKQASWQQQLHFVGSIANLRAATVAAESDGRITQINYRPGSIVEQGQILFETFNHDLKGQLETAFASLQTDQPHYERVLTLYNKGIESKDNVDAALQKVLVDQAEIRQYQGALANTVIRAPVTGKAGVNLVNVGDYVKAGDALADIVPQHPFYINFSLPGKYAHDIDAGNRIDFQLASDSNKTLRGRVVTVNSVVDQSTRNLTVWAEPNNSNLNVKPGEYVSVVAYLGKKIPVLVVPSTAVQYRLGGASIFVIQHGKAKAVPVKIIQEREGMVGVQGDVKVNSSVVAVSAGNVQNGSPLTIETQTKQDS